MFSRFCIFYDVKQRKKYVFYKKVDKNKGKNSLNAIFIVGNVGLIIIF